MVTLPPPFTATRYPGYFWNVDTQRLYSIKIGGELRPLKIKHPSVYNQLTQPAYPVSVKGRRRYLFLSELQRLRLEDSVIAMK